MIKIHRKILIVFSLIFTSMFGFSQSNEIKIKFIGNCGLYMSDGISNIYVDFPYKSGAHNYMEYDKSELDNIKDNAVFIYTHKHSDHYSKKLLKKLNGEKYGPWNISELEKLENTILDFKIEPFKTDHKVFGIAFKHYSYLITWHNKKIYLSGDTGNLEIVSKLKSIDWAFINPWMFMNAQNDNVTIDARMFGIYHLKSNQKLPEKEVPKNILFLKKQGEIISIPY